MSPKEKEKKYKILYDKIKIVLGETRDLISAMVTMTCMVREAFPNFLWVGFYRLVSEELFVGPYQGSLGCTAIPVGKGVCGKCAEKKRAIIVSDVSQFSGYISCNSRTKSEIVIPAFDIYGELIAVFDIDSPNLSEFDDVDKKHLENIVKLLADKKIFV